MVFHFEEFLFVSFSCLHLFLPPFGIIVFVKDLAILSEHGLVETFLQVAFSVLAFLIAFEAVDELFLEVKLGVWVLEGEQVVEVIAEDVVRVFPGDDSFEERVHAEERRVVVLG